MHVAPPDRERLLRYARLLLAEHGLRFLDAEDLVQDAYADWLGATAVRDPEAYVRTCLANEVEDRARRAAGGRGADPLDTEHSSLDVPWARGGS